MKKVVKQVGNFFGAVGRILKGQLWVPVGKSLADIDGLFINGDQDVLSLSDPFRGDEWKWIVLSAPHSAPYYIYFETEEVGSCMCYVNMISTPYVAMRIGPRAIKVVALSNLGRHADVIQLDVFFSPASAISIRKALADRSLLSKTTWI